MKAYHYPAKGFLTPFKGTEIPDNSSDGEGDGNPCGSFPDAAMTECSVS